MNSIASLIRPLRLAAAGTLFCALFAPGLLRAESSVAAWSSRHNGPVGGQDYAQAVVVDGSGNVVVTGFGYGHAGFGPDAAASRFTLDQGAGNDIHLYQTFTYTLYSGHLTGTWQPDGRSLDPLSPRVAFDTADRDKLLSSFNGGDPNGAWTIYFADLAGGNQCTLVG